ncbi:MULTISPECIES: cupin domain-containing protein [unclassified Kitasatospora]|uniref:cupin domain-containing protein n=1 Tax=unclassified Kitasatospora TaxID=2633591 RepID=UPI00070A81B3|nr:MULTISPECIES: cupin domain-containing protein [unclassified Kitasatospora]KQV20852.1 cupin [Kitasatospora sp. Root107]KRB60493.1 cupin [Kitasatospora sp. Root187]
MHDSASWAVRLGGDMFLAQALHRSYAVFPADDANCAPLLSWGDLNTILATHRMEPPRLRLSQDGETVPLHRYSAPITNRRGVTWNRVHPAELHARLAEGASLVVDAIDEIHPPIGAAAEALERFLGTPVQTNAYASWTEKEGFGRHWDDHDVVVVQQHGAKRWRLWEPTRTAPTFRDVESPEEPDGEPVADIVLHPGDVLYLPRGWWHAVTADQGTESLHLTFGLVTHTGGGLIGWLVDQMQADTIMRLDVPRHAEPAEKSAYRNALQAAMTTALSDPALIDRWADSTDTTHFGRPAPSLPYVEALPARREITVRITATRAKLTTNTAAGAVTLAAAGTEWEFAEQATPLLRTLLKGEPVTIGALADAARLETKDVAGLLTDLIKGQAVAVVKATP